MICTVVILGIEFYYSYVYSIPIHSEGPEGRAEQKPKVFDLVVSCLLSFVLQEWILDKGGQADFVYLGSVVCLSSTTERTACLVNITLLVFVKYDLILPKFNICFITIHSQCSTYGAMRIWFYTINKLLPFWIRNVYINWNESMNWIYSYIQFMA